MMYDDSLPWRDITGQGFHALLGPIQIAEMPDGTMPFALLLDDRHTNANGVCHGGVMMSVADSAMGSCAFHAAQNPVATVDFECDFLAAGRIGDRLHGIAKIARKARNIVFMESDLYSNDRRVMRASGIWAILPENSRARDMSKIKP